MTNNLWLKIKIWTKLIVFGALFIYAVFFALNNTGKPVEVWWLWFKPVYQASALTLLLIAFFSGVVVSFLVRTIFRTVWQLREATLRSRTVKLEKEMADMKTKAAMLNTQAPTSKENSSLETAGGDPGTQP